MRASRKALELVQKAGKVAVAFAKQGDLRSRRLVTYCSTRSGVRGKSECWKLYSMILWTILFRSEKRVFRARGQIRYHRSENLT